jgi:hypothetical protein
LGKNATIGLMAGRNPACGPVILVQRTNRAVIQEGRFDSSLRSKDIILYNFLSKFRKPFILYVVLLTYYFCFSNQANGLWNRLESRKPIFVEPRRKVEFTEVSSLTVYIYLLKLFDIFHLQSNYIFIVGKTIHKTNICIHKTILISHVQKCKILQQHH